jgi:hypothetical protein
LVAVVSPIYIKTIQYFAWTVAIILLKSFVYILILTHFIYKFIGVHVQILAKMDFNRDFVEILIMIWDFMPNRFNKNHFQRVFHISFNCFNQPFFWKCDILICKILFYTLYIKFDFFDNEWSKYLKLCIFYFDIANPFVLVLRL